MAKSEIQPPTETGYQFRDSTVSLSRGLLPELRAIAHRLEALNDSGTVSAFLTGGACRDYFMNKEPSDYDVEVCGIDNSDLNALVKDLFPERKIITPGEETNAPIKILLEDTHIDIKATKATLSDSLTRDTLPGARLRDFTCNAIYLDLMNNEIVDPYNGLDDIRNNTLRLIPERRTIDNLDSRIVLRACRLASTHTLELDAESEELLLQYDIHGQKELLCPYFFAKELEKGLCNSPSPSTMLQVTRQIQAIEYLLPEVSDLVGVPQSTTHHPEGDAFTHTCMVVDAAAELSTHLGARDRFIVMLSALFHDTGKAADTEMTQNDDGTVKITAHGHERTSAQLTQQFLKRIDLKRSDRTRVRKIVAQHMKPLELSMRFQTEEQQSTPAYWNEIRKLVKNITPELFQSFLIVCRADQLGRGSSDVIAQMRTVIDPIERTAADPELTIAATTPLLTAHQIEELGFHGTRKEISKLIEEIEAKRDSGQFRTVEQARKYLLLRHAPDKLLFDNSNVSKPEREQIYKTLSTLVARGSISTVSEVNHEIRSRL